MKPSFRPITHNLPLWLAFTALVQASPADYKITWTTPSIDSLDSMPLSVLHGAGANVWVQDGSSWPIWRTTVLMLVTITNSSVVTVSAEADRTSARPGRAAARHCNGWTR